MDLNKCVHIENLIFNYIDEFKVLFFPDQWSDIFIDFSKSELLAMLFLYRYKNANMTQIAEFINAPLNTATGVIGRLEKKQMVERVRSSEDRRIVLITLNDKSIGILEKEKAIVIDIITKIYNSITKEERLAAQSIFTKVIGIFRQIKDPLSQGSTRESRIKKILIE
jgi:MarR family transcriptional regulator, organic hydroperoxide resistance regulator